MTSLLHHKNQHLTLTLDLKSGSLAVEGYQDFENNINLTKATNDLVDVKF